MMLTLAHRDYKRRLITHAFLKVNDRSMSEDLVQETFMKTWKYLVRGGKIETMKAFLYHILNDLIVDEYRKHKSPSLDALIEKGFEPVSANSPSLANTILDGKAALILIQQLPEAYQKVMRMRYVQNLSLREMSLITGKSKNALAVQTHRGLEKLKLLYTEQGGA